VFKTLGRFNLYDWFINLKELKSNYNHATKMGSAFQWKKNHLPILEKYPELKDALVNML
jgi:hypothetical protein